MILINVKFPVRPERIDEWLSLAARYAREVSAEAGNVYFEWYRSIDDPNVFIAVEGFVDGDAGKAHMGTAHVADFMASAPDFVAGQPEIVYVDSPELTGWSPMGEIKPR